MAIITVPHPTLRQQATPIQKVSAETLALIDSLKKNLTANEKGVGLAAVQVNEPVRLFSTYLEQNGKTENNRLFRAYFNPEIIKTFGRAQLGGDEESTPLEGCLSIPNYYGPVPRFTKIRLSFQEWNGKHLINQEEEFEDFFARVIQHELDHLNGILFTDYSLQYDLPLYKEHPKSGKLIELNAAERQIFEII